MEVAEYLARLSTSAVTAQERASARLDGGLKKVCISLWLERADEVPARPKRVHVC